MIVVGVGYGVPSLPWTSEHIPERSSFIYCASSAGGSRSTLVWKDAGWLSYSVHFARRRVEDGDDVNLRHVHDFYDFPGGTLKIAVKYNGCQRCR